MLRRQDSVAELGAAVMQQADVAALWLLEALVLTLPQSLLQAYVVVSTDVGIASPGGFIAFTFVCDIYSRLLGIRNVSFVRTFIPLFLPHSGLLLWFVCAVYFLGPGAVQQSLLPDTTGPPVHASCSLAVPAGVAGRHAGCKGDLPYVFCPGL